MKMVYWPNHINILLQLMYIRLIQILILVLSTAMSYAQKQTSIQPLSPQESLGELNQVQPEGIPEYERVLKEYEKLIRKYPNKKELSYNLGNLNYLNGDSESALQRLRGGPGLQIDPTVDAIWSQLTSNSKRHHITMQWIPGHKNIDGNEAADKATKDAAS